jgi:phosphate/sulfate permease
MPTCLDPSYEQRMYACWLTAGERAAAGLPEEEPDCSDFDTAEDVQAIWDTPWCYRLPQRETCEEEDRARAVRKIADCYDSPVGAFCAFALHPSVIAASEPACPGIYKEAQALVSSRSTETVLWVAALGALALGIGAAVAARR